MRGHKFYFALRGETWFPIKVVGMWEQSLVHTAAPKIAPLARPYLPLKKDSKQWTSQYNGMPVIVFGRAMSVTKLF